ncbi:glycosyltransferase family 2 protein [Pedobacter sp. D749]|uniref:glycosyltransferase family 2 protein n=1 Tax=Pedobacter sp. D749 TaxID=2856523 RepID=UPI001C590DFC|nr:glycosyltransferase [Pedobacter sp. D749]QXU41672.1 glycosyltransferase [Pedobacter sp. D749]
MISIITAYYNRRKLFLRTLNSINLNYEKIDFEVIVVDDGSDEHERLEDLQIIFPFLKVIRLEKIDKWYNNPCIPFNLGFKQAKGDKIVIQNPECYHFDDILGYVDKHLKKNDYLSFGCFSLDKKNTDDDTLFFNRDNISSIIENNKYVVQVDGGLGWYNHSKYRPASYHFCTAIMTCDLVDLGGFDPRYAWGHGYDDDELIFRIKQKPLHIKFVDSVRVLHQNHYVNQTNIDEQKVKYLNEKATLNRNIFENVTQKTRFYRANYINVGKYCQIYRPSFIQNLKKRVKHILGMNIDNY